MKSYKEIGGYFELETYGAELYHKNAILLNSGRSALKLIIRAYEIKTLFIPYYTCPVVCEVITEENCDIIFYEIDNSFMPTQSFPDDAFIITNNYFGVSDDNINTLIKKHKNLIVDNAQSFYSKPQGLASFYSPRKFFGLPDGGLLFCERLLNKPLDKDISYDRTAHLLKRHDLGASAGYNDFMGNEHSVSGEPIKQISNLTRALMGNINYGKVKKIRKDNFLYLHDKLANVNELELSDNSICPMVYPLLIREQSIRNKLIENRIYVARYWEGIKAVDLENSFSTYLCDNLIPLPIDQRYDVEDMKFILKVLKYYV